MWWEKCENVIDFCLSTSVLPCQYYSAHALYYSSSNDAHTKRKKINAWKPSKFNDFPDIEGYEIQNYYHSVFMG